MNHSKTHISSPFADSVFFIRDFDSSDFELELTWLKEHPQPYDLGECEFHLAFKADDFDSAHKKQNKR